MIPDYTVSQFLGLNTFIKDLKTLKKGVASSSNNWITGKYGDHIELRRGSQLLGLGRDEEQIRNYIREQEKEDKRLDQLKMFD